MTDDRRLRAFKATDAFTLEAYRACNGRREGTHTALVRALRRAAIRSGGALVAAAAAVAGGRAERRLLERARSEMAESRYYLYLARRVGLFDLRRYRGLSNRQDVALRELDALLHPDSTGRALPP